MSSRRILALFACAVVFGVAVHGRAMPSMGGDGKHGGYGQPLAASDLPVGTVTVKVVGKDVADKRVGVAVRVVEAGSAASAASRPAGSALVRYTGSDGRARFAGLVVGKRFVAELGKGQGAVRSSVFAVPSEGGLKLLLSLGVAAAGLHGRGSAPTSKPAVIAATPGKTAKTPAVIAPTRDRRHLGLGPGTHLLGQVGKENMAFMQVLELINRGQAPIDPGPEGIVIAFPEGALNTAVAGKKGGPAQLAKDKRSARIVKVLPPGKSTLRLTFNLPTVGPRLAYRQRLTLPLAPSLFAVTNNNDLAVHGPLTMRREMRRGTAVFLFKGLPKGGDLEFTLGKIPHHDPLPRHLTLALVGLLLLWIVGAAVGTRQRRAQRHRRREALLEELVDLEEQRGAETLDRKAYAKRRAKALEELRQLWT